ncbi:hypothetical protein [Terrimonas alba]|uniref:hypothetical protein n=1 Tax=Terrimonas alba TaxID=3349636 RepID=UPI0035F38F3F
MEQAKPKSNRKKFLLWGATILSSITVLKFLPYNKKKNNEPGNETVKMLTRDGKLVEIDKKLLASSGKKISDKELQKWVKK